MRTFIIALHSFCFSHVMSLTILLIGLKLEIADFLSSISIHRENIRGIYHFVHIGRSSLPIGIYKHRTGFLCTRPCYLEGALSILEEKIDESKNGFSDSYECLKIVEGLPPSSEYATEPWIQSVSYSISHHVKGKDDQHDGQTGSKRENRI
jgi:hypothetical protein